MKSDHNISPNERLSLGLDGLRTDSRRVMPPADIFWTEFRKRAGDLPRSRRASKPALLFRRPAGWAFAAAAILVLSLTLRYAIISDSEPAGMMVEVIDVSEETDSYMIWEDAAGSGTIVWLMSPRSKSINGG